MPRNLVLYGLGHTNADLVRRFAEHPIPGCRLICVSKFPKATYSGMLPAVLAGQFPETAMQIDLRSLTKHAGGDLRIDDLESADLQNRTITLKESGTLAYDILSIGVGSVPKGDSAVMNQPCVLPIKPMQTFLARLLGRLAVLKETPGRKASIVIVGGGVAGVEIAFCLRRRLIDDYPELTFQLKILSAGDTIATGMTDKSVRRLEGLLRHADVQLSLGKRAENISDGVLWASDGTPHDCDLCIWATGASAPNVLGRMTAAKDDAGFLATRPTLQLVDHPEVFAVGDAGTCLERPHPKAGVYAVRQSPILWHNLNAQLNQRPLKSFQPQKDFLRLVNTGDGKALAQYRRWTLHHRGCLWLKNRIDLGFLHQHDLDG